jgi:uncharacterized protein (DUF1501 family)
MKSRRNFLRSCRTLAAAGITSQLSRLGEVTAQTQPGYRALVCIFQFGGNDSNNMIVPMDTVRYNAYRAMRGSVALGQGQLLPVSAGSLGYGFHPAMANMQRLYNARRAAMVFNVGTLTRPTTRADLYTGTRPRSLFSHSDQTQQWQTSDPNGGATGWGGRLNDALVPSTAILPAGISMNGGNSLLLNGVTSRSLNFANSDTFGLNSFGNDTGATARIEGLERVLTFDTGLQMVGAANGMLLDSIRSVRTVNAALANATPPANAFPTTGLGNQLQQVARLISVRGALGMSRQIFFAGIGGWDHHENLLPRHNELLGVVDGAIGAFQTAMDNMGISNDVTLFTESEFNRTGDANANIGTDHGWGGHHFIVGGAVRGGAAYGTFPRHVMGSADDSGDRGTFIPTTSLDQYAATLGAWFGANDTVLNGVFPNLNNFGSRNLGFML